MINIFRSQGYPVGKLVKLAKTGMKAVQCVRLNCVRIITNTHSHVHTHSLEIQKNVNAKNIPAASKQVLADQFRPCPRQLLTDSLKKEFLVKIGQNVTIETWIAYQDNNKFLARIASFKKNLYEYVSELSLTQKVPQ